MMWFDAELERTVPDSQLRAGIAYLIGCRSEEISIVRDDTDVLDGALASCSVFPNNGGQFALAISVSLGGTTQAVSDQLTIPEAGSVLARFLQMRVMVSNDETIDPYSFVLVDAYGESAVADVDGEALDEQRCVLVKRLSKSGPILRLDRESLVKMLVENTICGEGEINGCSPHEVDSIEQVIGRSLPWQYREFLFAMGQGAGALFRGEMFFRPDSKALQAHVRSCVAAFPDLWPLGKAIADSDGFFALSAFGDNGFRYFKLDVANDPVVYEWEPTMDWPMAAWPSLSAFFVASARHTVLCST